MPSTISPPTRQASSGPNDDLDGLFDDILGPDGNENITGKDTTESQNQTSAIDEEIKITKKRKPVAKLDEDRLLSAAGLPKLRKISKAKFKFNGKGHEFTDMAKLLNTYQLWLDDLFPKAKFLDGLAIIEKLGHKKKIQIYRKEWIDEGKPRSFEDDLDDFVASRRQVTEEHQQDGESRDQSGAISEQQDETMQENTASRNQLPAQDGNNGPDEPDEDELDALLGENFDEQGQTTKQQTESQHEGEEPDQDELDELLAEEALTGAGSRSLFGGPVSANHASDERPPEDFADEEEVMAGMDW